MSAEEKLTQLSLLVDAGEDARPEETDQLTRQLLAEICEIDVVSVELEREGSSPEGAKSAEAVTIGEIAVAVLPAFIPKVVEFLHDWSSRGDHPVKIRTKVGDRELEVEYSPKSMSQDELKSLVDTLTASVTEEKKEK